jgi:hypothetical protein
MRSRFYLICVLFLISGPQPSGVLGQPMPPGGTPEWPDPPPADHTSGPWQQRAVRERAVAHWGPASRAFVETYGEDAIAALAACRRPAALALVELHNSGRLNQVARPRELLKVIAKPENGSDVANWVIANAEELADRDKFDAFLRDPLCYALSLKTLEDGAKEVVIDRLRSPTSSQGRAARNAALSDGEVQVMVVCGALLVIIVLWKLHKRRTQGL